jgi:uncharacterized RDD family membrane protein YckC
VYQPPYAGYPPSGYQAEYGGVRAGFWSRFLGWFIDGLIGAALSIPGTVVFILSFAAGHDDVCYRSSTFNRDAGYYNCREPNVALLLLGVALWLVALIGWFAFLCIRLGRTGQTPGRRAAGVKVVDKYTGQPIGGGKALGRYLFAYFISAQICYLGYLWMLWDKPDKQTWHDKVVNSIVVRV